VGADPVGDPAAKTATGWWKEQSCRTRVGSGLARESSIFLLAKEALP